MVEWKRTCALLGALWFVCGSNSGAQALVGVEISGAGAPVVRSLVRAPDPGTCNYPDPDPITTFAATATGGCFAVPTGATRGDVAVDRDRGWIYVGMSGRIARYDMQGTFIDSFETPLSVNAMCANSVTGRLWIADIGLYAEIEPPPPGSCQVMAQTVRGPFFIPYGATWFLDFLTGLDFDPLTGSLIGCDLAGTVGSILPRPNPTRGPFGFFQADLVPCLATFGLTGIAFDHNRPGSGVFWTTDGQTVAYLEPGGAPATPTSYFPETCLTVSGAPLAGLAFSSVSVSYGQGSDSTGLAPPTLGVIGEPLVPSADFGFELEGSVPGSMALLVYGTGGAACPALTISRVDLLVRPPLDAFQIVPVDASGRASLATPVPETVPIGLEAQVQWLVSTPVPSLQASNAGELVFSHR